MVKQVKGKTGSQQKERAGSRKPATTRKEPGKSITGDRPSDQVTTTSTGPRNPAVKNKKL